MPWRPWSCRRSGHIVEPETGPPQDGFDSLPLSVELGTGREHLEQVLDIECVAGLDEHLVVCQTTRLEPREGNPVRDVPEPVAEPVSIARDHLDRPTMSTRRGRTPHGQPTSERDEKPPQATNALRTHASRHENCCA